MAWQHHLPDGCARALDFTGLPRVISPEARLEDALGNCAHPMPDDLA